MLQQVLVDGRLRRMVVVPRPSRLTRALIVAAGLGLAVLVAAGRGGSADGSLGTILALAVLVGGAIVIQSVSKRRPLVGFNPEGLYTPAGGWIGWERVRRIEVRRSGNVITGWRNALWVAFAPAGAAPDPATAAASGGAGPARAGTVEWLAVRPGWSPARLVTLSEEMEQLWWAGRASTPPQHRAAGTNPGGTAG
ncbi:MAG: hypothetical protein ACRDY0_03965 [Acidimicrobiales bacterium]